MYARNVLNLTLTLPKRCNILMWNGNNISAEVHLHDMHAHIHRAPTNLDCVAIRQLHLTCSLNDGKVTLDLDLRRSGSLRLVLELEERSCRAHVASMLTIDSQRVFECRHQLTDVIVALHVFLCRKATATNLTLRLIDLKRLVYLDLR